MTLQNRIKRLEADVRERLTGFCKCRGMAQFVIVKTPEEAVANREPTCCGECGREIERTTATFNIAKATDN